MQQAKAKRGKKKAKKKGKAQDKKPAAEAQPQAEATCAADHEAQADDSGLVRAQEADSALQAAVASEDLASIVSALTAACKCYY